MAKISGIPREVLAVSMLAVALVVPVFFGLSGNILIGHKAVCLLRRTLPGAFLLIPGSGQVWYLSQMPGTALELPLMLFLPLLHVQAQALCIIKICTGVNASFYDQLCSGNQWSISQLLGNDFKAPGFSISRRQPFLAFTVLLFPFLTSSFILMHPASHVSRYSCSISKCSLTDSMRPEDRTAALRKPPYPQWPHLASTSRPFDSSQCAVITATSPPLPGQRSPWT